MLRVDLVGLLVGIPYRYYGTHKGRTGLRVSPQGHLRSVCRTNRQRQGHPPARTKESIRQPALPAEHKRPDSAYSTTMPGLPNAPPGLPTPRTSQANFWSAQRASQAAGLRAVGAPSSSAAPAPAAAPNKLASGACYCGAVTVKATGQPVVKAICHCIDCRTWGGGTLSTH